MLIYCVTISNYAYMEVFDRIKEIRKHFFNDSNIKFAEFMEEKTGTTSGWVGGKRGIGKSVLDKILSKLPDVNPNWLLTGEGEMLKQESHETKINTNNTNKGVPYFEDIEASCSILDMPMTVPEIPTFYIDYEHFNDCTAYIPVVGDSMYPQYCAGEIVAVKKVNNPNILQWGEAYLVITNSEANDLRTIKLVHQSDNNEEIILRASNPNYKGDTRIPKKDIVSMFIIKGKIKRNQL